MAAFLILVLTRIPLLRHFPAVRRYADRQNATQFSEWLRSAQTVGIKIQASRSKDEAGAVVLTVQYVNLVEMAPQCHDLMGQVGDNINIFIEGKTLVIQATGRRVDDAAFTRVLATCYGMDSTARTGIRAIFHPESARTLPVLGGNNIVAADNVEVGTTLSLLFEQFSPAH